MTDLEASVAELRAMHQADIIKIDNLEGERVRLRASHDRLQIDNEKLRGIIKEARKVLELRQ